MPGERSNCPICGHDFRSDISKGARLVHTSPSGMFKASHLQENHADYLAWKRSKFKPSIVAGIATGIIFDFLLALVLHYYGILTSTWSRRSLAVPGCTLQCSTGSMASAQPLGSPQVQARMERTRRSPCIESIDGRFPTMTIVTVL